AERGLAGVGIFPTTLHTPRNSHAPKSQLRSQGAAASRFSADPRFLRWRDRQAFLARREDARGEIHPEAVGWQIAGDDLHEVVDAHARVVRGGRGAAWWTRVVSIVA